VKLKKFKKFFFNQPLIDKKNINKIKKQLLIVRY